MKTSRGPAAGNDSSPSGAVLLGMAYWQARFLSSRAEDKRQVLWKTHWERGCFLLGGSELYKIARGLHPEHPQIAARQSLFFVSRHGVLIQDIDTQQVAFRKLWSVSCDADLVSLCVYAW